MLYSLTILATIVAVMVRGEDDHDHMCNYWWSDLWAIPVLADQCYPYMSMSYMCSCDSISNSMGTVMMYNGTSCSGSGTTTTMGLCYCGGEDCEAHGEYNTATNVTCADGSETSFDFPTGCMYNEDMTAVIEMPAECERLTLDDGHKVNSLNFTWWTMVDTSNDTLPSTNCTWYEMQTETYLNSLGIWTQTGMIGGEECHDSTDVFITEVQCGDACYSTPSLFGLLMILLVAAVYN